MKKKKVVKETVDLTRAREIAEIVSILGQYIPRVDGTSGIIPLFSREFLLKKLIGLTEEEYKLNEDLLANECAKILDTVRTFAVSMDSAKTTVKPVKKTKEKVN